jgi:hypothetical protein
MAQHRKWICHEIAEGIHHCETSEKSGYLLSLPRLRKLHQRFPNFQTTSEMLHFFSDDCDAMAVIVTFSEHFLPEMVEEAKRRISKFRDNDSKWIQAVIGL